MLDLENASNTVDRWSYEFLRDYGQDFPTIIQALIVAEDHRAKHHAGIDTSSLLRATVRRLQGHRFGGVSTIEQQLARTIYPRRGRNLFTAKIGELVLSHQLSRSRPKLALWSAYLMVAYYGTNLQGYGAVRAKFCKTSRAVTKNQAAKIASCLKYPMPRAPSQAWRATHQLRTQYVLKRWQAL